MPPLNLPGGLLKGRILADSTTFSSNTLPNLSVTVFGGSGSLLRFTSAAAFHNLYLPKPSVICIGLPFSSRIQVLPCLSVHLFFTILGINTG